MMFWEPSTCPPLSPRRGRHHVLEFPKLNLQMKMQNSQLLLHHACLEAVMLLP
ncbi:rCG59109 [Rattus norvegicus]|uniref:RCG59109 n=1 Tax=Rattus norvegicus TaxID=10116 RepID=A6JPN9_RAT|nr:rCG59109 [Rattus norvegicus]